ncbi:MAG: DUF4982 domain-containing protein [Alistipes sp.]|nr:DUF4982 domain-containing protein [Alistipes senegalensis]MCM1250991.1 DUF4982 domain-containing protein [Alistipes sp.]
MRRAPILAALLCLLVACGSPEVRRTEDFNFEWRFALGDEEAYAAPEYDDSGWRPLHLPHDWAIEGDFSRENPSTPGGGALPGGIGWYRKEFPTPETLGTGRRLYAEFDGVFMNSTVYVNGRPLGTRPYGYSSFSYDLTPHLAPAGGRNVIAVRCDNAEQPNSRWYAGCGIYRNVRLVEVEPLHILYSGTYVTTPEVTEEEAAVRIATRIVNDGNEAIPEARLEHRIYDDRGRRVATAVEVFAANAGDTVEVAATLRVAAPRLWDTEHPALYRAESRILRDGAERDRYRTRFGIRTFGFSADEGFRLNGRRVKLRGVCLHHDQGALGAAVHRRALERQLGILREMGCNAIRTSHNPPAPELLDLCDEMGLLVMDEALDMWRRPKTRYDYARFFDEWHERDVEDFVRRDRNHPSIVMWSVGNEIIEQWDASDDDPADLPAEQANLLMNFLSRRRHGTAEGVNPSMLLTAHMVALVKAIDPTRPVIAGCNELRPRNNLLRSGALDIYGFNYGTALYDSTRIWYPDKPLLGSETVSSVQSRGFYVHPSTEPVPLPDDWRTIYDTPHHQCSAYDNSRVAWGDHHEKSWIAIRDRDWLAGTFVWTGFDYLGEPTPYTWPSRSSYFGIADLCGFPKDVYYMYRSEWTDTPTLHLFPHWNWTPGQRIDMWCYYNNADSVELRLNGRSLGFRAKSADRLHALWAQVPFEAGEIEAISYRAGRAENRTVRRTAGEPVALRLTPDRRRIAADGYDLSYVTVEAVDAAGNPVPTADRELRFRVTGTGELVGVDNGNAADTLSLRGTRKALFAGKALAIVRSRRGERGEAVLRAEGIGDGAETTIRTR